MSDDALFALIHEGDQAPVDYLMEKYKGLVRQRAKTLFLIGGDRDDLIQEGMIGLYQAVRDYEPGHAVEFPAFAGMCVTRQLYNAITASQRQKNTPLNDYIAIDTIPEDTQIAGEASSPETLVIHRETMSQLEQCLMKQLSPMERTVYERYIQGKSYTEIAQELDKEPKAIDNALQRIRAKLRGVLQKRESLYS